MFRRFYNDIKNTFYNPEFYKKIPNKGLSHPFWLFVKLSFVSAVVVVAMAVPFAVTFIQDAQKQAQTDYFPEELEIVIDEGIATTNLTEEPYSITSDIFDSELAPEEVETIVVINTKEELTLSDLAGEDAYVFVTRSGFVFRDQDELRFFNYDRIFEEEVVINKENVESLAVRVVDKLPLFAIVFVLIALIFLTLTSPFAWLIITAILSLITLVINKVRKLGYTYKNVYKLSMYAVIPAFVVDILTDILFGLASFSFLLTAAIFTVVLVWNTGTKDPQIAPTD